MNNNNGNILFKPFLIVLIVLAIIACFFLFQPFLREIIISAVLVSFFYKPFLWFKKIFKGRRVLAALVMCLLVLLIVIIPIVNLLIYSGKKSITAYSETASFINNIDDNLKYGVLSEFNLINLEDDNVKNFLLGSTQGIRDWIVKSAGDIVRGTTGFLFSLLIIILTMFFFFIDGERMLQKIKFLSPLPNKYDVELFKKFREMSYVAVVSTFFTAMVQGLVGAIGFMIIGLPAFFAGILIAFFSLIPYVGSMIIYVPVGIYLILTGELFKGIFILIWGALIVGNTDGVIRVWLIGGKSKLNPIFVLFSLMGGLILFGFWGLILGPLILALSVTVFYIYELEYGKKLDK